MNQLVLFSFIFLFIGIVDVKSCFAQDTQTQNIDVELISLPPTDSRFLQTEKFKPPTQWAIPWSKVESPRMRWHMTWSKKLDEIKLRLKDSYSDLITPVTIETVLIDNKLITYSGFAGCNRFSGGYQRYILKPETLKVKVKEGVIYYETTPEDIGTRITAFRSTLKGCQRKQHKEGGQELSYNPAILESFISKNALKVTHKWEGNTLEWQNESGEVIARFEKLADLTIQRNFWVLDPNKHDNDPILEQYFPPARVKIDFPHISISRGCGTFLARVDITDKNFQLSSKVSHYPCEDLFDLDKGQRVPYTPNEDAPYNLLARYMPQIKFYRLTGDGETRGLVLSNHDGKDLLYFIPSEPFSRTPYRTHIYDQLDGYEWNIQPHENISAQTLTRMNPIRIFRSEYIKDEPKGRASIISTQNCSIYGLNVSRSNTTFIKSEHRMNVYNSKLKSYPRCHGPAAAELKAEWKKAKKLLFDDNYLIFYDEDWNEVMRSTRGKSLEDIEVP